MARRRRQRRGTLSKPAGAFAPAVKGGRTIAWESINLTTTPIVISGAFPTLAFTTGLIATRFVTLIPENVLRGPITLERVRGQIHVWHGVTESAADLANWPIKISMQLAPLTAGVIQNSAILSSRNSADLESNRFIWKRDYYPRTGTSITAPGALEKLSSEDHSEIDIKSRRRFDRATWALILTCDCDTSVQSIGTLVAINLRALFRTPDGV